MQDRKTKQNAARSSTKKRIFTGITFLFPVAALLLLEIGLRVTNYGPDLSLFTTEEIAGKRYHIMNPDVKHRYFSRFQFNPNSSPDYFLVPKPAGTMRIFCLGGSTTVGYPYWYVGSFSTFLRDRLKRLFPDRKVEVINLGLTATNSFTVLDMARELVAYEPDLFVVYDGHNEFYGALGIASNESVGGNRWLVTMYLKLVHLKTFLLVRDVIVALRGIVSTSGGEELSGTMMERLSRGQYVAYGSHVYENALRTFEANLRALEELCEEHSIPLILTSQVSNLRHLPPFMSETTVSDPSARTQFEEWLEKGKSFWNEGRFDSALAAFRYCLSYDSLHAEMHYFLARCLDTLGVKREAEVEYRKARDYDQLRFRTSSDFNNVIRRMDDGNRVVVIDVEQVFRGHSPDSLIGNELILEHLHPNVRGYFLIARALAKAMKQHALFASREEWERRDTIGDEQFWKERALTEFDERCAQRRTEYLVSGWPFRPQGIPVRPVNQSDPIERIVEAVVRGKISWEQGHVAAAEYYEGTGDYERAEREYRAITNQIPLTVSPYLRISAMYLRQRRLHDARSLLLASLDVEPTSYAYRVLGSLAVDDGRLEEAIAHLEKAYAVSNTKSDRSQSGYLLALAYLKKGDAGRAVELLQRVLTVDPDYTLARDLLRRITTGGNQIPPEVF